MGDEKGETRFQCSGDIGDVAFYPDGNYVRSSLHYDISDTTKETDSQYVEMGRCSVITP